MPPRLSPDAHHPRRALTPHSGAVRPPLRSYHRRGCAVDADTEPCRSDQAQQHAAFVVAVDRRQACGGSTRATPARSAALTHVRRCSPRERAVRHRKATLTPTLTLTLTR